MAQSSDISLDASRFDPSSVTAKTAALNEDLIEKGKSNPKWWEVLSIAPGLLP